jgi:hypothetical protein
VLPDRFAVGVVSVQFVVGTRVEDPVADERKLVGDAVTLVGDEGRVVGDEGKVFGDESTLVVSFGAL